MLAWDFEDKKNVKIKNTNNFISLYLFLKDYKHNIEKQKKTTSKKLVFYDFFCRKTTI